MDRRRRKRRRRVFFFFFFCSAAAAVVSFAPGRHSPVLRHSPPDPPAAVSVRLRCKRKTRGFVDASPEGTVASRTAAPPRRVSGGRRRVPRPPSLARSHIADARAHSADQPPPLGHQEVRALWASDEGSQRESPRIHRDCLDVSLPVHCGSPPGLQEIPQHSVWTSRLRKEDLSSA